MTWFMCPRRHIIESKSYATRDVFCGLCNKIVMKHDCTKYRLVKITPWKLTTEHRKKLSLSHKGVKFTEEHRQKIGLSKKLAHQKKIQKEENIQIEQLPNRPQLRIPG